MSGPAVAAAPVDDPEAVSSTTSCLTTCVKNEGPYLIEWIAYHKVLGFSEIAIYDNESSDGTFALLSPLAEQGEIYLERVENRAKVSPQLDAYKRELQRESATEWVMFIDADEFVVLREPITFNAFLAGFPPDVSQICLNWRIFGSSGHVDQTDGLVIERFLQASASAAKPNNQGKSVARRARIDRPRIHASYVSGPTVHDDGSPADMPKCLGITTRVSHARAAVHHYILKSRAEFTAKMERGRGSEPVGSPEKFRKKRDWYWDVHDLNDEFNDEALSRIAEVRAEIDRLRSIIWRALEAGTISVTPPVNGPSNTVAARVEALESRLDQITKESAARRKQTNKKTIEFESTAKRHQKRLRRLKRQIKTLKDRRKRSRWFG